MDFLWYGIRYTVSRWLYPTVPVQVRFHDDPPSGGGPEARERRCNSHDEALIGRLHRKLSSNTVQWLRRQAAAVIGGGTAAAGGGDGALLRGTSEETTVFHSMASAFSDKMPAGGLPNSAAAGAPSLVAATAARAGAASGPAGGEGEALLDGVLLWGVLLAMAAILMAGLAMLVQDAARAAP